MSERLSDLTADQATATAHAGDPITIGKRRPAREDVGNEPDNSKAKGVNKGRADTAKQDGNDEDEEFNKRRKGLGK